MRCGHLIIAILIIFLLLPGCFETQIIPLAAPRNGQNRADLNWTSRSYVLGYFEGKSGLAECRDGIESVKISQGVMDSIIHILVGGIYSPRTVEVHCIRPHLNTAALMAYKTETLHGVYFDSNSSRIQGDSDLILDELAAFLKQHPEMNIRIVGHTDLTGGTVANGILSLERAEAAENYLIKRGIDSARLSAEGRGAREPLVQAYDADSSALNRRIEVIPVRPTGAPATAQAKNRQTGTSAVKDAESESVQVAPGESTTTFTIATDAIHAKPVESAVIPTVAPASVPAKPKEPPPADLQTIIMDDGTIVKGTIINQSRDQVVLMVGDRKVTLMKSQVRRINYGK